MATERYKPKLRWKQTQIDARDPPTDYDWTGYDGADAIGRTRKEMHGPTKGRWHWAGWFPNIFRGKPPAPNAGYAPTCREAMQKCEEYWRKVKAVMETRSR